MIWEQCLPNCVAQVDPYNTYFDGQGTEQICNIESVMIESAKQPIIIFVNHEAHQVMLENDH